MPIRVGLIALLLYSVAGAAVALGMPEQPYGFPDDAGEVWDGEPLTAADYGLKGDPAWVRVQGDPASGPTELVFDRLGRLVLSVTPTSDGLGSDTFEIEYDTEGVVSQGWIRDHPEERYRAAFTDRFYRFDDGRTIIVVDDSDGHIPYSFPPELYDLETPIPDSLALPNGSESGTMLAKEIVFIFSDDRVPMAAATILHYEKGYVRIARRYRFDDRRRRAEVRDYRYECSYGELSITDNPMLDYLVVDSFSLDGRGNWIRRERRQVPRAAVSATYEDTGEPRYEIPPDLLQTAPNAVTLRTIEYRE